MIAHLGQSKLVGFATCLDGFAKCDGHSNRVAGDGDGGIYKDRIGS